MISAKEYEEMWDLADELAEKERDEQNQTLKFKLERRDIHIKRMLEKGIVEKITEQKREPLRRTL
jgi:hypothetical protein